ncbi:putative reverse transcriptase domain-containing protein [Tanacetum coccineum]
MVKLMVEIESFGMSSDEFDKEIGSSDGLQPKQADLSCVHALNELHLHKIRVVPMKAAEGKREILGCYDEDDVEEFCRMDEISRMEDELRNLRLMDHDVAAYTNRFNELVLLCPDVVPSTKKKISQYIKGLLSYIQGETYSSKPTTLNEAIRMAHGLMEHKVQGWKENTNQNKRKWEGGNQGNN